MDDHARRDAGGDNLKDGVAIPSSSCPHVENQASIIIGSGFTQTEMSTGLRRLYNDLVELYPCRTTVMPLMQRRWKDDVYSTALNVVDSGPKKIIVIGFSYAGGVFAPALCKTLASMGRDVDALFLIDPVPRFLPLRWLPVRIKPGENVICGWTWRQSNGAPRGHEVDWNPGTTVKVDRDISRIRKDIKHGDMDSMAEIHGTIKRGIEKVLK